MLEALADAATSGSVALLATLRPEGPIWPVVRRLVQRKAATLIELTPLDVDDVRTMVASCLDGEPPAALLEAVVAAEAVPLFIEELLATYEQRVNLSLENGEWRFRPTKPALPAMVAEAVAARLDELPGGR